MRVSKRPTFTEVLKVENLVWSVLLDVCIRHHMIYIILCYIYVVSYNLHNAVLYRQTCADWTKMRNMFMVCSMEAVLPI